MLKNGDQIEGSVLELATGPINERMNGSLDGLTLFRFAHMFKRSSAGGMEVYLRDLNRSLLERNALRILQMYLSPENQPVEVEIQRIGRGEMVWIPSSLNSDALSESTGTPKLLTKLKRRLGLTSLVNHESLLKALDSYTVDLAAFHWISEDSMVVLKHLNKKKVPFVVINHFHNERLARPMQKDYISGAMGIGGVSSVDVPASVGKKFANLSDGIDVGFFQPEKAVPLGIKVEKPLIFMPSRITEGKGHLDAVRALCRLKRQRINATLCFAGRVESESLMKALRGLISEEGVGSNVLFAGELQAEDLRDWYGASDLVLLTSYSEGLGRVLLEAQAMEKVAIAYSVGGVPEALKHGETGYLTEAGDIEALTETLKEVLESEKKREEMGRMARKHMLSRFSIEQLAARHEEFYKEAILRSKL